MPLKNSSTNGKRPLLWQQVLIVAITLTVVAVAILLGRQTYRETRERATEQFNQQQLILARAAAAGIEAYYKELSDALSSLANLPNIQHMASESLTCIQHTYWGFPPRTSIRLLDSDGILRFIYPFDGWQGELIGRDYGEEPYFQGARDTGRISVSGLIVNEQGETRIRIAVPVYLTYKTETVRVGDESGIIATPIDPDEPEAGRFQGVLVGSLDPYIIAQDFISPIVSGKTGYAWLLNEEGIFIAHHEEGFTGRNGFEVRAARNPDISYESIEQIQQRMMAGEEGVGRYVSGWHRGQKGEVEKLIAYTPVHINGNTWSVAVCAPVSEAEEVIQMTKRTEQYTLAFVILALMAGGLCLFTTSYRWSRSLEREVGRRTRELGETSDYLSNLIRYANAPIIVWNPDRQVTIFNQAFEKMSGRTEAEMMGQPPDVLFPKESRSDALYKIEDASKGEYWETVEIPILRQDGEIRLGLWNSANIYGEDGKTLVATVAQGQDITERKRAEERLRLLSSAVEQSTEGVAVADLKGHLLFVNNAFASMHGYTPEELVGEHLSIFHTPEQMPSVEAANRQIQETGEFSGEVWHARRDGAAFPTLMHNSLLRDEAGNPIGIIGTLRDITERVRAEEALQESRDAYRATFETTGTAMLIGEEDTTISMINAEFEKLCGYSKEEVEGKKRWIEFIMKADLERMKDHHRLRMIDPNAAPPYYEFQFIDKHGNVKDVFITLALIPGTKKTVGSLLDVTEHKRAEEALRASELRYRITIDAMGYAIHLVGPDLRFTLANPAHRQWAKELGSGTPDYIGQTIFEVFPSLPDGVRDRLRDEYDRVFRTGETLITEESTMFGDRELVTETRKIPIFKKGRVTQVVTVMRDITERVQAEEALRQNAERLRILREIDQAITSTLALPEVLDQLTRVLTMTLGINRCSIWLLDESGEFLQGRGYGAQPGEPDVESIRLPRTESMVVRLFKAGQPLMVHDVNDPAYASVINIEYIAAFHIRAFLAVPLVLRNQVTGLLVLDDTRTARVFQTEEIQLAQSVATQAAIAIENAWLFEKVRAGREQLRNLTSYLQTARDEERAYIAREIHDEFGQSLTALKMDLAWLTKRLADRPHLAEKASTMSDLIDSTIQTVRRVATQLRPGLLDDLGLAAAIEWQAQELAERTGINCELYLGDEDIVLARDLSTAVFRIFQETLTNVARHAEATEVRVELEEGPDELVLTIRDNGKGITPSQVSDPHSLGLIGMQERARSWGGNVTFQSVPGQGTVVTVRVPRPDADEGRK